MKIRSIALNQFKKFTTPTCLHGIGDGLNVVVGPNEMGKSTLLDALRAALFEKYSSKAQPIVALQNDRNQAAPVVELTFEIEDGVYRVRKRFVKKPYAQLFCPDGRVLEGDEAEDTLRRLLGFDEPGKQGAKPETLGMWNVLWVQQGQSFGALDLPDSARSNLQNALESEVGEVLGGKRGKALPDAVDKQLSELVTSTGKPRGRYKALAGELEELTAECASLKARRVDLSQKLEELETTEEDLARISSGESDNADKEELAATRTRHAELARLEASIDAASTQAELKKRELERAEQAVEARQALRKQFEEDAKTVEAAKERLDEVQQTSRDLRATVESLRQEVKQAEDDGTKAEKAVSRGRRILAAVQRDTQIRQLEERHETVREAEKKQRLAQQSASAILVAEGNIRKIRAAAKEQEEARSRLSAAATLIMFDMPPDRLSKVEVDGESLTTDTTTLRVVEATTINLPDCGTISVEPAIKDRNKLLERQREATKALETALEECGVASLDDAEEKFAEREKLLRSAELAKQEAELLAPAEADYGAGAEALADHIASLKSHFEADLEDLGIDILPTEEVATQDLVVSEAASQEAKERFNKVRAALLGPEEEMSRYQAELGRARERHESLSEKLEKLKNRLAEDEQQVSDEELGTAVASTRSALSSQIQTVSELEAQREGETLAQLEARISRLETALQKRHDKRSSLNEKAAGLRSHIEVLEGAGLDEAIQQKEREIELVQHQLAICEREVSVLSLLLSTLRSAESKAKERYLSPVLNRVRPYLQLMFPGAEIKIDENLHIVGVERQEGYEEAFDHLSMGTQEQIAVLVRLAFAEMLVEQGHPATVVLDDALVFSDDRRMGRMFDILNIVGEQVQIIVLTCREQLFEGIGGRVLSLEAAGDEDLASA